MSTRPSGASCACVPFRAASSFSASIARQESSNSPNCWRVSRNPSALGKSCMVLSQASRLPVTKWVRKSFQARETAKKLMKLPMIIRGTDITPCSQPYNRVVKRTRWETRSVRATKLAPKSQRIQSASMKGDGKRLGVKSKTEANAKSKNWIAKTYASMPTYAVTMPLRSRMSRYRLAKEPLQPVCSQPCKPIPSAHRARWRYAVQGVGEELAHAQGHG